MATGKVINELISELEYLRCQQNSDREAICHLQKQVVVLEKIK